MSTLGALGLSGILSGGTVGPPSGDGYTSITVICGQVNGPVDGTNSYTLGALIGATNFTMMLVNNVPLTEGVDFTFTSGSGTIDTPFNWVTGDTAVLTFKSGI